MYLQTFFFKHWLLCTRCDIFNLQNKWAKAGCDTNHTIPWMAIRKEIRNRKCFCSWYKLSTCLSHSKVEFGPTLLEFNRCKSGAIERSIGLWIANPLFFFPLPLLKSKHIFNGGFVVWVAFGFLSAQFFLMWLDYIRYELPSGWKPTPGRLFSLLVAETWQGNAKPFHRSWVIFREAFFMPL